MDQRLATKMETRKASITDVSTAKSNDGKQSSRTPVVSYDCDIEQSHTKGLDA